jgi:hypothetical protein
MRTTRRQLEDEESEDVDSNDASGENSGEDEQPNYPVEEDEEISSQTEEDEELGDQVEEDEELSDQMDEDQELGDYVEEDHREDSRLDGVGRSSKSSQLRSELQGQDQELPVVALRKSREEDHKKGQAISRQLVRTPISILSILIPFLSRQCMMHSSMHAFDYKRASLLLTNFHVCVLLCFC